MRERRGPVKKRHAQKRAISTSASHVIGIQIFDLYRTVHAYLRTQHEQFCQ